MAAGTNRVYVRNIPIGGGAPVTVQSMTNTDTADADRTAEQILCFEKAGCDIARFSVYNEACFKAIPAIRAKTHIPLVADVHFDHTLAIGAIENGIDKLRINPGNIGGRANVEKLADCAKAHHVPIRIGVNGGSLEKDLKPLYATDPARAMVESALRHVRMLEDAGFYDIVISLKSSGVAATVQAYRLLSQTVQYPLHIGITETGSVSRGIIKSAAGIGALLLDGIGDTLRVSLTDDPVREVETGLEILRALRLRNDDVEIVACPTCGRTRVDLMAAVDRINRELPHNKGYLRVAVMGCAVNGPGEASDADIGIAFGSGNGVLFRSGVKFAAGDAEDMIRLLVQTASQMLADKEL